MLTKAMTSITIKEYFAVAGSFLSNKDARKIGPVLDELSKQGALTARDVVDAARSTNSSLHDYFEWDDKAAADHFRVEVARRMLRSVKIKFFEEEKAADGTLIRTSLRETRAFQTLRNSAYEPTARQYRTFEVLHGDSAFAAQMMDTAFVDLIGWRGKYEPYIQMWKNFGDTFQSIINQISEWEEEFAVGQAASATDSALAELFAWRESNADVLRTWTNCREQIEFVMSAIRDAEMAFAVLNEKKHRDCIRCGKSFVSVSVGNRICPKCLGLKTVNENAAHMDGSLIELTRK